MDLSQQANLKILKADYNKLTHLDLSQATELVEVEINNNQIIDLDVQNSPHLNKLIAFNNPLYQLTYDENQSFDSFSIENTPLIAAHRPQTNEKKRVVEYFIPKVTVLDAGMINPNGYSITSGQTLAPKLGDYIGFRYEVTLRKNNKGEVAPILAKHSQYPIMVRMVHPEYIDSNTGEATTAHIWSDTMFKHNKNLAIWHFSDERELVAGDWIMQIYYNDVLVVEQAFKLQ